MANWSASRRRFHEVSRRSRERARSAAASPVQQWQTLLQAYGPIWGDDGAVWFAEPLYLGRFDAASQTLQQFEVLQGQIAQGPALTDLVMNSGLMWFGVENANQIGWSTLGGQAAFAATSGMATGLVVGPNGNVWFAVSRQPSGVGTPAIGQITPGGDVQESPTTFYTADPLTGPDGNVWFGEWGPKIGVATPSGTVTEYDTSAGAVTSDLIIGPDGAVWYGTDLVIGRIDPVTRTVQEFDVGRNGAFGLTIGPDGNIWFGSSFAAQIGCVTTAGAVEVIGISNLPAGLAMDMQGGNVWFTEFGANVGFVAIGSTTPTEFPIIGASPYPPVFAPASGTLWFPDNGELLAPALLGAATTAGIVGEYDVSGVPNGFLLDPAGSYVYFTALGGLGRVAAG
ncbi:MAG TPA: hypothetical protein VHS78_19765 [Candidatus Elarobacter sp.]|jgi:streptogramin lyase|nr:hypothetical protein [Candidatus Elarobacter sp.]